VQRINLNDGDKRTWQPFLMITNKDDGSNGEKFIKTYQRVPFDEQIGIGKRSECFAHYDFENRRGEAMSIGNQKKDLAGIGIQPFGQ
jgi:hypothetical protein